MTRQTQVAQKTQRAVQDLDAYCRQLERLTRRMSRIVTKPEPDAEDYEAIAPLDSAVARLDQAILKLKSVTPVLPAAEGLSETENLQLAEALVNDPSSDRFVEALNNLVTDSQDDFAQDPSSEPGKCVLRGVSPSMTVPAVLEFLAMQRKSGTLRIKTSSENFTIEIAVGQIVHAVSDSTPHDERLGSILLCRGLIGAEQLQQLLASEDGTMLGSMLYRKSLVSKEDLLAALEAQASLIFRRLFAHRDTEFAFYDGEASNIDIQIEANVTSLLLEGARGNDESNNQPSTDWEDWLK